MSVPTENKSTASLCKLHFSLALQAQPLGSLMPEYPCIRSYLDCNELQCDRREAELSLADISVGNLLASGVPNPSVCTWPMARAVVVYVN
jgi:hypothetical protein